MVHAQKMVKYGISVSVLCFLFVPAIAERTSVAVSQKNFGVKLGLVLTFRFRLALNSFYNTVSTRKSK